MNYYIFAIVLIAILISLIKPANKKYKKRISHVDGGGHYHKSSSDSDCGDGGSD